MASSGWSAAQKWDCATAETRRSKVAAAAAVMPAGADRRGARCGEGGLRTGVMWMGSLLGGGRRCVGDTGTGRLLIDFPRSPSTPGGWGISHFAPQLPIAQPEFGMLKR